MLTISIKLTVNSYVPVKLCRFVHIMCQQKLCLFVITPGECQCDSGVTAPMCPTRSNNPQTVISDFDRPNDVIPFSVAYGAVLSTDCGTLSSGRSLVFK